MAKLTRWMRFWLIGLGLVWVTTCAIACGQPAAVISPPTKLTIGLVSYDEGAGALEKYQGFQTYLAEQLKAVVEVEPVFNEIRALEQIQAKAWSLVFAPSGLAAVAIAEAQYVPIFPMQGSPNQRALLVVRADSPLTSLTDLANQPIVLGEVGSATGYYLPLYDLYGLTLKEIRFAPTPKTVLDWVADRTVAAGALSEENFQRFRDQAGVGLRVLHQTRRVPPGAVLLSPTVERNQQQLIEQTMAAAPSIITADAAYIPNAAPPDLSQLIELVQKVRPLEEKVREKPAVLTLD